MNFNTVLFLISGIVGGFLGGMGMGGGTLLIPILTIFLSVSQHTAQAVNLVSFIPMGIVAVILHAKNKLIKKDGLILTVIFATVFAVIGSFVSVKINGDILKRVFGGFLIVLAVIEFFISKKVNKQNLE